MRHESEGPVEVHAGAVAVRAARRGAKVHSRGAMRTSVLVALVGVTMLGNAACAYRAQVPPSQLSALLASREEKVRVRDVDGDWVTVDRTEVREVAILAHPGFRFMTGGYGDRRLGAQMGVPIREDQEDEAERRGWSSSLDGLEGQSIGMALRGDMLVVESDHVSAVVRLQDVAYVQMREPNHVGTALIVLGSIAVVGVLGYLSIASCKGCAFAGEG